PDLSALTGNQPATKDDMKDVVKKQQHEPVSSSTEKKIDKGVDTIWNDIELVGTKAKDIDHPQFAQVDNGRGHVNNDETPKTTDAAGDLKKAYDKYHDARTEWLKKQPNWNKLVHDWTQSPNTDEGIKKSTKAKKKIDKLTDEFNQGDGKQLVDDWKT